MEQIIIRETLKKRYVFDPIDRMYKLYEDGVLTKTWAEGEWFENQRTFYEDLMSQRDGLRKLQSELGVRSKELDKRSKELDKREEIINKMVNLLALTANA